MSVKEIKEVTIDVNIDNNTRYLVRESNWYTPFTSDVSKLFRLFQKEYGKCVSKIYVDIPMGDGTYDQRTCGWVFEKKQSDSDGDWVRENWVEVRP